MRKTLGWYDPAYTLILLGTNDWHTCKNLPPSQCYTIDSLRNIVETVKDWQSLPVLGTLPPANPAIAPRSRNEWNDTMNALIKPLARQQNVAVADLNAEFVAAGNLPSLFDDDVHPERRRLPGARPGLAEGHHGRALDDGLEPSPLRLLARALIGAVGRRGRPRSGNHGSGASFSMARCGGRADGLVLVRQMPRQRRLARRCLQAAERRRGGTADVRIRVFERPHSAGAPVASALRPMRPRAMIASRRTWPFSSATAATRPGTASFARGPRCPRARAAFQR